MYQTIDIASEIKLLDKEVEEFERSPYFHRTCARCYFDDNDKNLDDLFWECQDFEDSRVATVYEGGCEYRNHKQRKRRLFQKRKMAAILQFGLNDREVARSNPFAPQALNVYSSL